MLSKALTALSIGERFWFWFCLTSPTFPLLIAPFSKEKGMEKLLRKVQDIDLPMGAQVCTGMGVVNKVGELQLASPLFQAGMLRSFAKKVRLDLTEYPALAFLSGASFLKVHANGNILQQYTNPDCWDGIKRPSRIGSLQAAKQMIDSLGIGEEGWIWLRENENNVAHQVITILRNDDPSAKQFAAKVLAGRALVQSEDPGLRGMVRKTSKNNLVITTADELKQIGEKTSSWFRKKYNVHLIQKMNGKIITAMSVKMITPQHDLVNQMRLLNSLPDKQECYFWFGNEAQSDSANLWVADSIQTLKSKMTGETKLRGKIVRMKWGFEFQVTRQYPDFLQELALWVQKNRKVCSEVLLLVKSRMTVWSKSGELVKKMKDDTMWENIIT